MGRVRQVAREERGARGGGRARRGAWGGRRCSDARAAPRRAALRRRASPAKPGVHAARQLQIAPSTKGGRECESCSPSSTSKYLPTARGACPDCALSAPPVLHSGDARHVLISSGQLALGVRRSQNKDTGRRQMNLIRR